MKRFLLAVPAVALAAAAHAQDKAIEVKLSGHIDRAILRADDGGEAKWFNVDNGNSSTRFRFNAEGDAGSGLRAGILFEVDFASNPSSQVNFSNRNIPAAFNERHMDLFLRGGFGMLRLGQGDGAANGASEVDLSGTTVAHYSSTTDVGGGFLFRDTSGVLSTASVGAVISNQDFESRYDRLYYQTPSFNGFTGEVSWGNKQEDVVELAVRYSGRLEGIGQLAAALGYSKEDAPAGGPGPDDKTIGGSVSWLHSSGLNLTFAHTARDLPGREGKFDYLKIGYKFGNHALSFDYGKGKDQGLAGDDAKQFGLGYVWTPIAWAEVFGLVKKHSLDRPGASLDDILFAMVGSRVKF